MNEPLEKPQGKVLKKFNQYDKNGVLIGEDLEVKVPEWVRKLLEKVE